MRSVVLAVVFVTLLAVGTAPVAATVGGPDSRSLAAGSEPVDAADTPIVADRQRLQAPTEGDRTTVWQADDGRTPSTTFAIDLQADRSAEWQVTIEYDLTDEYQREAFRSIAEAFEEGTDEVGPEIELYENLASTASERTGRSMEIQNVDRSSSLQGDVGTLRLTFTWTEFLKPDGEKLVFNDALRTPENDSWLTSLDETQELRITTPRGYAITSANVGFSDNTVTVTGPHTFDSTDHIRITLEPSSFGNTSIQLLGAAVLVAAAIISGALLLRRQNNGVDNGATATTNGGVATEQAVHDEPTEPDGAEPDEPDEDLSLLADDERVIRLLERNGGRMRQAKIVSETKWSDAKVSQLLSSMADDEQIEKLRIGRENLISLPGVDALGGGTDGADEDEDR